MAAELIDALWEKLLESGWREGVTEGTLFCYVCYEDSTERAFEFIIASMEGASSVLGFSCKFGYIINPEHEEKAKDLIFLLNKHLVVGNLDLNDENEVCLLYSLLINKDRLPDTLLREIEMIREVMMSNVHDLCPAFVCIQEKDKSPHEAEKIVAGEEYNA